ncbi:MAG: LysM peptidoglycan-binding domain-containing protein [Akkermansiaceae bacterium]
MNLSLTLLASCAVALFLTSCGNSGGGASSSLGLANTGPFDRNGNYIEEWADNPSKWRKSGGPPSPHELKSDRLPEIALNDQPPRNSVPMVSTSVSRPAAAKPAPVLVKAKPQPKAPPQVRYVVKKGDTLSAIASRNRSSVAAIQKANRITGTLIRPGQSLIIPKR